MIYSADKQCWLKYGSLSPAVTLNIRSRSPKPNQLFIVSQCYIHANLVKIRQQVHKISCRQETVRLTPTSMSRGSAPKNNMCSLFSGGGHKKILYKHWDSLFTESPPFLRNRDIVFIKDAFTLGSSLIILYHFH